MGLRGWFSRGSARQRGGRTSGADARYLADWARSHVGVEAFVEPRTTVTPVTVVLVAADGEWTRRAVGGERGARKLGEDLRIPVYDVRKTGYPQRMRDHDARQRILRKRAREA
ncbi:oxidoreductase [Rhodococcus sp. NPDC003318]|uniref:oxidoreductase n=1 Tax=Rhodococcus sp. NPDC003318 TaxID=3364503 RepID=UPI0036A56C35